MRRFSASTEIFSTSKRVQQTDVPIVTHMRKLIGLNNDSLSLAQGVVYWSPPESALQKLRFDISDSSSKLHGYCPNSGLLSLQQAILRRLSEKGIHNSNVMITSGANQGFTNIVLTLVDSSDSVVVFRPYYFNHVMAIQMTGGGRSLVIGDVDSELIPDMNWLENHLETTTSTKMVIICNPCNPTGVMYPKETMLRARDICKKYNSWLIVDNTYNLFTYSDDMPHHSVEGSHVINLYSFSKSYGMMGWRVGYIAYPPHIESEMLKIQDTIAICPPVASQYLALASMEMPSSWVDDKVASLRSNREAVLKALAPLISYKNADGKIFGGTGAIYLWVRLPTVLTNNKALLVWLQSEPRLAEGVRVGAIPLPQTIDEAISDWIGLKHGILIIAGSSCGMSGHIRVCYANLSPALCTVACEQLHSGLLEVMNKANEFSNNQSLSYS